ncbi:MAG: response regulator, partial [Verrucomicrobiota bacterium]
TAASSGIPYGVAFIDFGMPEMDGLAVARAIKAEPALAHTRLIMLTVRGRTIREEELRGAGVFRCHFKPLRQALLSDCLEVIPGNASEKARPAASAVSIRSERILLAEDSPLNQTVALGYLRKLGYAADLVVNGLEALEKTRVGEYDIVLMDYQMPEMDGLQATRAIREHEGNRKHTWIIAMTANAMQGDREHCLAAGMDDYLSKPLRPDALAAALERARIVSGVREGG